MRAIRLPNLEAALRRLIAKIPHGRVTTYGALARALGAASAARWVGGFLARHDHTCDCVCHRVVRKNGETGLWVNGSADEKHALLAAENIRVQNGIVDLTRFGFDAFNTSGPLRRLAAIQEEVRTGVSLRNYRGRPGYVAGVDLSYSRKSAEGSSFAVAAYCLVDSRHQELVKSVTVRQRVRFPYIPGFLSFREAPLLSALLDRVRQDDAIADVVLVDGNGILHPRRAGIATFLGVRCDVRTIGIGKSLLCGTIGDAGPSDRGARPVRHDGDLVGFEVGNKPASRPIYVSPGHLLTARNALRIVRSLFADHRVPEPIYHADRVSRRVIREHDG